MSHLKVINASRGCTHKYKEKKKKKIAMEIFILTDNVFKNN